MSSRESSDGFWRGRAYSEVSGGGGGTHGAGGDRDRSGDGGYSGDTSIDSGQSTEYSQDHRMRGERDEWTHPRHGPSDASEFNRAMNSRERSNGLPPPRSFPRRLDYNEVSWGGGGRSGSWRDGGRGGRFIAGGDPDRYGGGGYSRGESRHIRHNNSSGGWRRPFNENLVAEMKIGPTGHNDANLRNKYPQIQEPSQLACYSRVRDGSVHMDERSLRQFRPAVLTDYGADLNEGFESYVEKKEDTDGSGFGDLLACVRTKGPPLDNVHFVTFRNNLNKILGTAYNRRDPWEMGVHRRRNTVYLHVRKSPERENEHQRRCCYWGYSFERLATDPPRGSSESTDGADKRGTSEQVIVDANVEFCAVLSTEIGPHRFIMGAELDCYELGPDGKENYVELKTSRELDARTVGSFERHKLLKFWQIQSFLAGVPRIVCGFRDDQGILVRTETMTTKEIPQRAKTKHYWEGDVCLAFADQVFCWLYGSVKENEDYLLQFVPSANSLELLRADSCPEVITKHLEELRPADLLLRETLRSGGKIFGQP